MIDGGHLYPIINKHHQRSLAQIKDNPKRTFKPKQEKTTKRKVNVFHRPENILMMLGHKKSTEYEIFDIKQCENDIFVCTTPNVVHDLFYDLLKMKLYTKNIRTDNKRIIQFDITNMTIQENTNYRGYIIVLYGNAYAVIYCCTKKKYYSTTVNFYNVIVCSKILL